MRNYFNYFTEIEEHFCRRRGTATLLSTLDWALIEAWREAGIPLAAVLSGIDTAFDRYEARAGKGKGRLRKINGLAWAAQAVMQETERLTEASVGAAPKEALQRESGFEQEGIATYLENNAEELATSQIAEPARTTLSGIGHSLREIGTQLRQNPLALSNEEIEQRMTVLEDKLLAALKLVTPEAETVAWREQANRELASHRSRLAGTQIRQLTEHFLSKRMLERWKMPRLSLFYMQHN